jgi:hypothetical protein
MLKDMTIARSAIRWYFEFENLQEFKKEWDHVDADSRKELGVLAAAELGVNLKSITPNPTPSK